MQVLIHWQKQIPVAFPLIFSSISEYETNFIIAIQSKAKELKSICFHEISWPTIRNCVEKSHQWRRWRRCELLLISNLNCPIHILLLTSTILLGKLHEVLTDAGLYMPHKVPIIHESFIAQSERESSSHRRVCNTRR